MKHKYLKNVTTLRLEPEKCTGCGICTQVCPHGILSINKLKAEINDKDYCIECGACMTNCPFSAISVETGTGCAYAFIRSMFTKGKPSCGPSNNNGSCC